MNNGNVEQGFLIKRKNGKIVVNRKKTSSILLNQLQVDLLMKYRMYFGRRKGKLLDAGCGEKPYSLIYNDFVSESIGCDVETCVHDQKDVDVFSSIDKLPFEDNSFGTILCTNVMEHVAEMERGYQELSRCLCKGGYLIQITPFLYPTHEKPYDYYRFTEYGIRHQMKKNGLCAECVIPLGGVGFMLAVYFNLFITRFLKWRFLTVLNCYLQKIFYSFYRKISFNKMCKQKNGISSIISCGYFVIATKS